MGRLSPRSPGGSDGAENPREAPTTHHRETNDVEGLLAREAPQEAGTPGSFYRSNVSYSSCHNFAISVSIKAMRANFVFKFNFHKFVFKYCKIMNFIQIWQQITLLNKLSASTNCDGNTCRHQHMDPRVSNHVTPDWAHL